MPQTQCSSQHHRHSSPLANQSTLECDWLSRHPGVNGIDYSCHVHCTTNGPWRLRKWQSTLSPRSSLRSSLLNLLPNLLQHCSRLLMLTFNSLLSLSLCLVSCMPVQNLSILFSKVAPEFLNVSNPWSLPLRCPNTGSRRRTAAFDGGN